MSVLLLFTSLALCPLILALVRPHGVGKLPALGWNSWNAYGCNINATAIMDAANAMVDLGFVDAGYEYVNLDDCWSVKDGRDNITGQIIPDPVKFPSGIKGLADDIHELGLKVGIYSSAGTTTCADYPASLGHESLDAATFAGWGIDYLKYDNCNFPSNWTDTCDSCIYSISLPTDFSNGTCINGTGLCAAGYDYSKSNTAKRYRIMRDALLAQDRTILYAMCDWGDAGVETWGNATGNSWRMSTDIRANFDYVLLIMNMNSFLLNYVDFWGHGDADMLEVGNSGLTAAETRTHFAFWAAMKSPIILGTDLNKLSAANVAILLNPYLLAFNQDDIVGASAKPFKWGTNPDWTFNVTNPAEFWSGKSSEGTLVLMLNTLVASRTMTSYFAEIPDHTRAGAYQVTNVWTGEDLGCVYNRITVSVASHDTAAYLVGARC